MKFLGHGGGVRGHHRIGQIGCFFVLGSFQLLHRLVFFLSVCIIHVQSQNALPHTLVKHLWLKPLLGILHDGPRQESAVLNCVNNYMCNENVIA